MSLFTDKAPKIMADLRRDFAPFSAEDAAAILGNIGHECGGFTLMQEQNPTVKGSRGGLGWAQWTGPRRRAYEAWCVKNKLNPVSDAANYGYMVVELRGSEKSAIPAVRNADTLEKKVVAFELNFERAGIKHYPNRINYAKQALVAFTKAAPAPSPPDLEPVVLPAPPASPAQPSALVTNIIVLIVLAIAVFGIWQWTH
jgi:hypothetical protein